MRFLEYVMQVIAGREAAALCYFLQRQRGLQQLAAYEFEANLLQVFAEGNICLLLEDPLQLPRADLHAFCYPSKVRGRRKLSEMN